MSPDAVANDVAREAKDDYADLVAGAARGDRRAMERLLMRAQEVAYRFSLLVCGHREDAEDVMQEALFRTYRYVNRIADPQAFRTWLYKTVRNACLMKRRRRVGEPAAFEPLGDASTDARRRASALDVPDVAPAPDRQLIEQADSSRLRRALRALPAAYRAIVVMRDIEGLSTREVAEVTGYTEANVKTRLHRARLMLRRQLESA